MPENINLHEVFASFFSSPDIETAAKVVSEKLAEGHTCVDIATHNSIEENAKIDIDALKSNKWITNISEDKISEVKPFVLDGNNLYLQRYYSYETEIIDRINLLIKKEGDDKVFAEDGLRLNMPFIKGLFADHKTNNSQTPEENINWQLTAALTSILSNFSIITGGPGTGKTTTVAKLLAILFTLKPELKVALAAPTGKAAARMKESLNNAGKSLDKKFRDKFNNLNASTLHRLLGYRHGTHYFKHDKDNPLDFDVIIIDESSMIGASMMAKLLNAISSTSKIIMLGDKDQLASVEAGSIFGDICLTQRKSMNSVSKQRAEFINSFIADEKAQLNSSFINDSESVNTLQQHIVELKKSWRFKSSEGIGKFSRAVISGKLSDSLFEKPNTNGEYVMVSNDYESDELQELFSLYKDYIKEPNINKALKKINKVRILCAVRSGKYGMHNYNKMVEEYLENEKLITPNDSFYENQPIMITKNDAELNLFNGDVGIIRKGIDGKLKAYFELAEAATGYVEISTIYLPEYITVYAMTIHKSQGSEFEHVGVVLPDDENQPLLTRELIYTAITRAKKSAIVFASKEVLESGVAKQVERASGITNRFIKK
jgi:exodeoxyribonuclease V alpha subunit